MRVGVCVHAILLTLVGCGSSQSASLEVADGPDAAIAADVDPAGALQWITQQPVWDRAAVGIDSATIDPRILIAVLQPSRATWLVAARSTLRETLELLEAMRTRMAHSLALLKEGLRATGGKLGALSPLRVLERGYSITFAPDGTVLRCADAVHRDDEMRTEIHGGEIRSRVLTAKPVERGIMQEDGSDA